MRFSFEMTVSALRQQIVRSISRQFGLNIQPDAANYLADSLADLGDDLDVDGSIHTIVDAVLKQDGMPHHIYSD